MTHTFVSCFITIWLLQQHAVLLCIFQNTEIDLSDLFTLGVNGGCNVAIVFIVGFTEAIFFSYYKPTAFTL